MADDSITPAPEYDEAAAAAPPYAQAEAGRKPGKAVASLVCGIISLFILGPILGIVAIVLGVLARKEIAADPSLDGAGLALAGIITGAIGAVLAIVLIAAGVNFV
jgi:hypothetical protein